MINNTRHKFEQPLASQAHTGRDFDGDYYDFLQPLDAHSFLSRSVGSFPLLKRMISNSTLQ
ncbi:MAG: hypothetical protein ACRDBQ_21395, partial [Shewanella sp.]